jgi:hypothetical protein
MSQLDKSIQAERQRRLSFLRQKQFAELQSLPEASSEVVVLGGEKVTFTTFREQRTISELLVLVRSDRSFLLGIGSMGATEGFIMGSDGSDRDALNEDITDLLG